MAAVSSTSSSSIGQFSHVENITADDAAVPPSGMDAWTKMLISSRMPESPGRSDADSDAGVILVLDPWNTIGYKQLQAALANPSESDREFFHQDPEAHARAEEYVAKHAPRYLDGCLLRKTCPDRIPVWVEKGETRFTPDINAMKYHVPRDMTLDKLVHFIEVHLIRHDGFPLDMYFENTKYPADALISEIDEKHKGGDGFLQVTYSRKPPSRPKRRRMGYVLSKPIVVLDPCNLMESPAWFGRQSHCLDAWKLRETCTDKIPVSVDKDASSDYPDAEEKKYHVPGDMTLWEFVDTMTWLIWRSDPEPTYWYLKKTIPAIGALVSAVDEENMDEEDGFLHVTYSGKEMEGALCIRGEYC